MKRIGIDQTFGDVYENVGIYWRAIWPTPITANAILDPTLPAQFTNSPRGSNHIFREDAFDPLARVRRGGFYDLANQPQPSQAWVLAHPGGMYPGEARRADGVFERSLYVYDQHQGIPDLTAPKLVALGSPESIWRVLGWERIATDEFLWTLKTRHGLGILPEVDRERIPELGQGKAVETLKTLIDATHRESPSSIVDRARDAAQWCLGTWAAAKFDDNGLITKDLGAIIRTLRNKADQLIATDAANIVRILHARKPNEQERLSTRPIMEDDAELAVRAVAFMLREFGWVEV